MIEQVADDQLRKYALECIFEHCFGFHKYGSLVAQACIQHTAENGYMYFNYYHHCILVLQIIFVLSGIEFLYYRLIHSIQLHMITMNNTVKTSCFSLTCTGVCMALTCTSSWSKDTSKSVQKMVILRAIYQFLFKLQKKFPCTCTRVLH